MEHLSAYMTCTQSHTRSCGKSLFDANKRAGRNNLPLIKNVTKHPARRPGPLTEHLPQSQGSWCPRHSRPRRAGCSVLKHCAEEGLVFPGYADPPWPELHSSVHQTNWKNRHLEENAFNNTLAIKRKVSVQTQFPVGLGGKSKKGDLPSVFSCQVCRKKQVVLPSWFMLIYTYQHIHCIWKLSNINIQFQGKIILDLEFTLHILKYAIVIAVLFLTTAHESIISKPRVY